ncbi:probable apyrase 6 isoform X1 [Triticum dicoccoides]|uniref:probable apyrase 6 isoform X1 n=1 Tax=Triticum dicoccoides TaxID=85692 RepID=UPI001891D513|nr:probable apyrase 6 isoform X1 [Triticum dicoccoides]
MREPTKPLSPRPSRGRCRLCGLCLGSALLAIVVSTLVHLLSPPPQPAPSPRFSVIIDGGSTGTRAHVFSLGPDGRPDLARSAVMRVSPGLSSFAADTARAGESLRPLLEFAKEKVGGEGAAAATEVRLMATAGLRLLEEGVREAILVSCRNALRASGFRFEDSWAKVIPGSDEGIYAWIAANYALGTLGGDPHKTIGIIELGGASAQLTFVSDEVLPLELSTNFTFGETTYTLYSNSFLNFGQNAAQDSYHQILKSRGSSKNGTLVDPCAPKGYSHKRKVLARTSGASRSNLENQYVDNGSGNYKTCRSSSMMMMQEGKEKCKYQQCHLGSNFVPELLGHFLATENFYFTSKFFGLDRSSSLSDFVVAGEQLCNKDLSTLRQKYLNHSDEDFSRYCFSSAYIVALLHDSLGVPLDDKRIEYSNQIGDTHIEWALGAFIANTKDRILGASGAAATQAPKHRPLLAVLGAFLACGVFLGLRWRKPKTKIIYDLEKGRYIMTRIS